MNTQVKWYIMYFFFIIYTTAIAQKKEDVIININNCNDGGIVFQKSGNNDPIHILKIDPNSSPLSFKFNLINEVKLGKCTDSIKVKLGGDRIRKYQIINGEKDTISIENKKGQSELIVALIKDGMEILKDTVLIKWEKTINTDDVKDKILTFSSKPYQVNKLLKDKFGEDEKEVVDQYKKIKDRIVYHYYHGPISKRGYYKTYFKDSLRCEPVNFNKETLDCKADIKFKIHNVNRYLYDISIDHQLIAYGSELNDSFAQLMFGTSVGQSIHSKITDEFKTFMINYSNLYNQWQNDLYLKTKPTSLENRIKNISEVNRQRDLFYYKLGNKKNKKDSLIMQELPPTELFTEIKKFYAEFEDNFAFTINHINLRQGNQLNLDIKILPKKIGALDLSNNNEILFRDSVGFEDHINLPIVKKWFYSFSTGTYFTLFNSIKETEYKWSKIPDLKGGFIEKYQLIKDDLNQNPTGLSAYVNAQHRCYENFGVGFSFGFGVKNHQLSSLSNNFDPTYLAGVSGFFGSDRQFILTGGVAWTEVKVLKPYLKSFYDNKIVFDDGSSFNANEFYRKKTRASFFLAISYTPFNHYKVKNGKIQSPKQVSSSGM